MRIEKQQKKMVLAVSVTFLIAFLLGATYVYAITSSDTFIISAGIYPGTPKYTIYESSGVYYAKNSFGAVVDSDSDAYNLVQPLIDAFPATSVHGGIIQFDVGRFNFSAGISNTAKHGITIKGAGWASTSLDFGNVNGNAILIGSASGELYYNAVKDVRIIISSNAIGIHAIRSYYMAIDNVRITSNAGGHAIGINFDGTTTPSQFIGYNTIYQPEITNAEIGILFNGTSSANNVIGGRIKGNSETHVNSTGIYITSNGAAAYTDTVSVVSTWIEYYEKGIFIDTYAHDNHFTNVRLERMANAIVVQGNDNSFIGTSFSQGSFVNYLVTDTGDGNVFRDSYDFPTERYGNATVATGLSSVIITHGVYWENLTYLKIFLTPSWSTTTYVSSINGLNFTANFGTAASGDQYVLWHVAWIKSLEDY